MSRRGNGEGSITQRKDGRWQGSLQLEGERRAVYGKTRAEALHRLKALRETAEKAHRLPSPYKATLGDFLTDWLEQAEPMLRPKTLDMYGLVIRAHVIPHLGRTPLVKLTPLKLAQHYATLRKSTGAAMVQKTHRVLHKALADAAKWGLVPNNVAALVDTPKAQRTELALWSPEQIAAFIDHTLSTAAHYAPLFGFLLASGCREGEALGLRWNDIDWQKGTVRIERQIVQVGKAFIEQTPKTKAGIRVITLPSFGLEALKLQKAKASSVRIFTTTTGTTPGKDNVRRSLHAICKGLGVPAIRVHALRHLHLSLLAMNGVPLKVAQARAGHSTAAVTLNIYQHVLGDADRLAADALERAVSRVV